MLIYLFKIFIICLFLNPITNLAHSVQVGFQDYRTGIYFCSEFDKHKNNYEKNPDMLNVRGTYGYCLLIKGDKPELAMSLLQEAVEENNNVNFAFTIADYISTDGTLNPKDININTLNESIQAYEQVLTSIKSHIYYPKPESAIIPTKWHNELNAHRLLVLHHYLRSLYGSVGHHNELVQSSPSYAEEQDRWINRLRNFARKNLDAYEESLKFYPQYSNRINNFKTTQQVAANCAQLPLKKHFDRTFYNQVLEFCNLIQSHVTELLPLERKKMTSADLCSDVMFCAEYQKILTQLDHIKNRELQQETRIFASMFQKPEKKIKANGLTSLQASF